MTLNACMTVDLGVETLACEEIKELLGITPTSTSPGYVLFSVAEPNDLIRLAYQSRLARRVLLVLGETSFKEDLLCLKEKINWALFEKIAPSSFAVRCERHGLHPFRTLEIEELVGAWTKEKFPDCKVTLSNPQLPLFVWVCEDRAVFGIDIVGTDLSKREYRVFIGAHSLKGTLGSALLRLAGFSKNSILLDPFCGSGIIPIEAALYASKTSALKFKKSLSAAKLSLFSAVDTLLAQMDASSSAPTAKITGFDPVLACVSSSRKNAKIAGVQKFIQFSKVDAEWIDLKFEEKSVDCVVTNPPQTSNKIPASKIDPIYNEFFHQVKYVLKDKGTLAIITSKPNHIKVHAKAKNFELAKELCVFSGKMELSMLRFKKQ